MAIRLVDLDKPLEPVILPSGREVQVIAITGAVMQLREEFQQSQDLKLLWQVVAQLLPDAKEKEVAGLTIGQCMGVVAIAMGNGAQIMAEIEGEARKRKELEGKTKATPQSRKGRRRVTGSAS